MGIAQRRLLPCCTRRQAVPAAAVESRTRRLRAPTSKGHSHAGQGPALHGRSSMRTATPGAGHAAADSAAAEALMFMIADASGEHAAALVKGRRTAGSAAAGSPAGPEDEQVRLGAQSSPDGWQDVAVLPGTLFCPATTSICTCTGWLAADQNVWRARAAFALPLQKEQPGPSTRWRRLCHGPAAAGSTGPLTSSQTDLAQPCPLTGC